MPLGEAAKRWGVLLLYSMVLLALVRPGSPGPAFVTDIGTAMSALVRTAIGGKIPGSAS